MEYPIQFCTECFDICVETNLRSAFECMVHSNNFPNWWPERWSVFWHRKSMPINRMCRQIDWAKIVDLRIVASSQNHIVQFSVDKCLSNHLRYNRKRNSVACKITLIYVNIASAMGMSWFDWSFWNFVHTHRANLTWTFGKHSNDSIREWPRGWYCAYLLILIFDRIVLLSNIRLFTWWFD